MQHIMKRVGDIMVDELNLPYQLGRYWVGDAPEMYWMGRYNPLGLYETPDTSETWGTFYLSFHKRGELTPSDVAQVETVWDKFRQGYTEPLAPGVSWHCTVMQFRWDDTHVTDFHRAEITLNIKEWKAF